MPRVRIEKTHELGTVLVVVDASGMGGERGTHWVFCKDGKIACMIVKFGSGKDDFVWYGGLSEAVTTMTADITGHLLKKPVVSIEKPSPNQQEWLDILDGLNQILEQDKQP